MQLDRHASATELHQTQLRQKSHTFCLPPSPGSLPSSFRAQARTPPRLVASARLRILLDSEPFSVLRRTLSHVGALCHAWDLRSLCHNGLAGYDVEDRLAGFGYGGLVVLT